jgi:hypothetical protein
VLKESLAVISQRIGQKDLFHLRLPCLDESQLRFDPVFDDSPGIRAA